MAISSTDPIGRAWDRMVLVLFQPFDLGKWFVLGFSAFLAFLGQSGGGFGYQYRFFNPRPMPQPYPMPMNPSGGPWPNSGQPPMPPVFPPLRTMFPFLPPPGVSPLVALSNYLGLVIVIGAIAVIFTVALTLLILWLNARGKFMFIHALATNRAAVVEPWKEFRTLANSLFKVKVVIAMIAWVAFLSVSLVGMTIAWPSIVAQTMGPPAIQGLIVGGAMLILLALVHGIVNSVVDYFIMPGMYARRERFLATWRAVHEQIIRPNLGTVVVFILLRWLLAVGSIFVMIIATCCTCCCAALPYLGTVILLPVFVFLECCALYFVHQAGGRWQIFADEDPLCPSCGYDLRGNPGAASCPECGTPLDPAPIEIPPDEPA